MNNVALFHARTYERKFFRYIKKQGYFKTVTGKVNRLFSCTGEHLVFQTEKSDSELSISRYKIRRAINFVFFKRMAIRKDMEQFSKYSSALFGVLFKIFEDICFIQKMANGLLRLSLKGLRFYFSGVPRSKKDMKMIAEEGGTHVLLSFYDIKHNTNMLWLRYLEEFGLHAIIDSGAFSIYSANKRKKDSKAKGNLMQLELFEMEETISVEEYATFINHFKDHPQIVGFLNLDVIGDPGATKENYHKLKSLTDCEIIPVWQINDTFENLEEIVKDCPSLIGLGGSVPLLKKNQKDQVREIFDEVFSRFPSERFHWCGGANDMLLDYNWASSDSSSWLSARKNGEKKVYLPNGVRVIAKDNMTTQEVMRQQIRFLSCLEYCFGQLYMSI